MTIDVLWNYVHEEQTGTWRYSLAANGILRVNSEIVPKTKEPHTLGFYYGLWPVGQTRGLDGSTIERFQAGEHCLRRITQGFNQWWDVEAVIESAIKKGGAL